MGKHHHLSQTRLYKTFLNMRQRCYNPKCPDYRFYGRKGITICDEWLDDFTSFYRWSIEHGYSDELTIDRINPNKGYAPDNCQWITFAENRERAGTGRPTDNKKGKPIHVRLDEKSEDILDTYTEQEHISRAEAIRRGIYKLESEIKK